jgi:hypothetical protein
VPARARVIKRRRATGGNTTAMSDVEEAKLVRIGSAEPPRRQARMTRWLFENRIRSSSERGGVRRRDETNPIEPVASRRKTVVAAQKRGNVRKSTARR